MDKEKMLYHANENGSLKFEVRSMKGETQENLQFLLDGGYLVPNSGSVFGGNYNKPWSDFKITSDGKILLSIFRLNYVHQHYFETEKHHKRIREFCTKLKEYNREWQYFEPSLSKNQKKAVKYALQFDNLAEPPTHNIVSKIKQAEVVTQKVANQLDKIDIDEVSLTSMFNMSVGLGKHGTDASRHEDYVMKKCAEEMGELALEINISQGLSYKEAGKDGIKGEAVDLAICALDMFALQFPDSTAEEIEREFLTYMVTKLHKWRNSLQ